MQNGRSFDSDYLSVEEVFSTFYEAGERRGSVAVLHRVYFDDSSDGTQSRYVIAAGLIGTQGTWNKFDRRWKAVLREEPNIGWFHANEWRSRTGEFAKFRNENEWPKPSGWQAADAKRDKLKHVIESSSLVAIGCAVLIPSYNRIRCLHPEAKRLFPLDAYEGALQSLVFECAKAVKRVGEEHCVGYISDDSNRAATYSAVYSDFKANNPGIGVSMRGLSHLDDKKWPGLQAADLVAHITNQVYARTLPVDGEIERMTRLPELDGTFYRIVYWNERYMCHVLRDLSGIDLFQQLGIADDQNPSEEEL